MSGGHVQLESLTKRFDDVTAVDGISLEVQPGEFFSLLGPSGCGKTTTLRMIAGFEPPSAGKILLDGTDVASWAPNRRNVNTVFQNYALFPFLNVEENVAFGMRYQSVPKAQRSSRVAEALELVQLSGYGKRRPNQLSGGQQQRVALARALVLRPAVLLLDEPLGALDAKIRKQLRIELKALQEEVGITFVFVTHDQEEALSMSDRMAVMNEGQIEQIGSPAEVYEDPGTMFVADFLGVSNLMEAEAVGWRDGECTLQVGEFHLRSCCGEVGTRGPVKVVVRPERIQLLEHGASQENSLPGMIQRSVYVGSTLHVFVQLFEGTTIQVWITNTGQADAGTAGTPVSVHLPAEALRVLGAGDEPAPAEREGEAAGTVAAGA
ncbi:MAG TPA: ABC transporter ATP-binding protein [Solirubrobacteraceae bacterium]|jgi:spermidine/putrescine transport system ATP-binding protein|nr:ABC transporter ATP-binding protein [Solirubrobacteraceae bacterium]